MALTTDEIDKQHSTSQHEAAQHVKVDQVGEGEGVPGKCEPEEALETHEVVELNKFTERKEWIEEKIKFLESMPPIEIFAGVDTLVAHAEEIPPGLPTRAQLNCWLEEHDMIEKETEVFDVEDMSKLKKLTKAATQRNLSPEDTDLIELTLTTLLALDKLLHLLRDRSESLDLLGLRLTWEEQRVTSWRERRSLMDDLEVFLNTRARWSLDTYELPPSTPSTSPALRFTSPPPPTPSRPSSSLAKRRDSVASVASISSDTSSSMIASSAAFPRSTRYKLAEMLSHDAALISSRLTALNHSKVMAAGKTLDKLIDTSRKPVPDEILDEQDHLEDKAVKEIETVGRFAMTVVMQWKRADEFYNDIIRDQSAAQALIAELNNAKLHHPTTRHDTAFMSRAQALLKRLAVKGDPALPRSSFPRPTHPLFLDQAGFNETLIKALSTEHSEALNLARQADVAAQAYHTRLEAVKWAEMFIEQMRDLEKQLEKSANKLVKGVQEGHEHGDASPPDLDTDACLDPTRHATFLALLPSVVQEFDQAHLASEGVLRNGMAASLRLKELPGIDIVLQKELASTMDALERKQDSTRLAKEDILARAQRLKEARHLWVVLNNIMDGVEGVKNLVIEGMENQMWKPSRSQRDGAPVTPDPDSPELTQTGLPASSTPHALSQQIDALKEQLSTEFVKRLTPLLPSLENPLSLHLQSSSDGLAAFINEISGMVRVWDRIIKQTEAILAVENDGREFGHMIDMLQTEVDDLRQSVLLGDRNLEDSSTLESDLQARTAILRDSVRTFTDSLATRVPMVSNADSSRRKFSRSNSTSSYPTSFDQQINRLKAPPEMTFAFDLSELDHDVRAHGNTLALRLGGGMQSLSKKFEYLQLSRLAKVSDQSTEALGLLLDGLEQEHSKFRSSFESAFSNKDQSGCDAAFSQQLASMIEQSDQLADQLHTRVSQLAPAVEQSLQSLRDAPGAHDSPIHGVIVTPRMKVSGDVLQRVDTLNESITQLRSRIVIAKDEEDDRLRLEKERLEAEESSRIERERLKEQSESQLEVSSKAGGSAVPDNTFPCAESSTSMETTSFHEPTSSQNEASLHDGSLQVSRISTPEMLSQASTQPETLDEDVFGRLLAPSPSSINPRPSHMTDLRARIMSLRTRLRSLNLHNLVRPPTNHDGNLNAILPSLKESFDIRFAFSSIAADTAALPERVEEDATIDSELKSLRSQLHTAGALAQRLVCLGQVSDAVNKCDHVLSDLLEHADSYPATPSTHHLASSYICDVNLPCEKQLADRLAFTKGIMDEMDKACVPVGDDPRVTAEQTRLQQTWSELAEMCTDRINGTRSRAASSVSSTGRSTGAGSSMKPSLDGNGPRPRRKESLTRRALSITHDTTSRPSTQMSSRSVSNPSGSSSLFNTTFASRQRTTSLASIPSANTTPFKRQVSPVTRRASSRRPGSPSISEVSGHSLASPFRSTWSRAPRQSFGSVSRSIHTPDFAKRKKAYVANPKSRLDVAVGNVVNNFKLHVTIQAVDDSWRDQSGKYWIGDTEPKLCFCRILRSQTVMVRVGGGWCELSKFLKGHFADLLAELPPSPPRREERWINAATVREAMETGATPAGTAHGSTTPEPKGHGLLPSFQISTPDGSSPQSLKATSSPSSSSPGLTPFQFMRRADAGFRPASPSPTKSVRTKPVVPGATPSRTYVWRP